MNVIVLRNRVDEAISTAYAHELDRRDDVLRDVIRRERNCARLALQALRRVPTTEHVESMDLALIARQHRDNAVALQKLLETRTSL